MGTEEWQTYCPQCQVVRLGRRDRVNHVLHFLVALFTCGLWVPVWLVLWLVASGKPFRCSVCGTDGVNE